MALMPSVSRRWRSRIETGLVRIAPSVPMITSHEKANAVVADLVKGLNTADERISILLAQLTPDCGKPLALAVERRLYETVKHNPTLLLKYAGYENSIIREAIAVVAGKAINPDDQNDPLRALLERYLADSDKWVRIKAKRGLAGEGAERPSVEDAAREYIAEFGDPAHTPTRSQAQLATGQFLKHIEDVARSEQEDFLNDKLMLRKHERIVFVVSMISSILALLILITGAYLIFSDRMGVGILAEVLGALTGGGTLLIRNIGSRLDKKRRDIEDRQHDNYQVLLAVQAALAIPDSDDRAKEIAGLASWLRERAMSTVK